MRKAVEEYLKDCGRRVERPPEEPAPLTLGGLVDGFLVHVLRLDPESYRRAFWREAYRNGHTIGHVPRTFEGFLRRNARTFEQKVSLFLALTALFGVYTVAALLYRRLSLVLRRLRRPAYYERERERRRKLAEARREIRKHHTLNPKPTFDAIRAALRVARSSPESALRLGSLLEDLECFVDNTLIHDVQGQIVGRRGGIKRPCRPRRSCPRRIRTTLRPSNRQCPPIPFQRQRLFPVDFLQCPSPCPRQHRD